MSYASTRLRVLEFAEGSIPLPTTSHLPRAVAELKEEGFIDADMKLTAPGVVYLKLLRSPHYDRYC